MIEITEQMKELVDRAHADGWDCTIGTVAKDGQPQLSLKAALWPMTLRPWHTGSVPSAPP